MTISIEQLAILSSLSTSQEPKSLLAWELERFFGHNYSMASKVVDGLVVMGYARYVPKIGKYEITSEGIEAMSEGAKGFKACYDIIYRVANINNH
jgi:DNA-binding IclR family transcriptional regulator